MPPLRVCGPAFYLLRAITAPQKCYTMNSSSFLRCNRSLTGEALLSNSEQFCKRTSATKRPDCASREGGHGQALKKEGDEGMR